MPFAPTKAYRLDRRSLMKWTGTIGLGAAFVNPMELLAAEQCEAVTGQIPKGTTARGADQTLQYWIDGLHFGARTDVKSRANLAVYMALPQTEFSFVESVVLVDPAGKILGARYFDASTKSSDGYVPYAIFDNIELNSEATYRVFYNVRKGSDSIIYSAVINKPVVTRMNNLFLPPLIQKDFQKFLLGDKDNPTPGLVTTPFQFYTLNGLDLHCARGKITNIGSEGDFTVNIDFMHGDSSVDHYMRYFIVLDPVGRILGIRKRAYQEATGTGLTCNVGKVSAADIAKFGIEPDPAKALYGIPQIGDIRDCPYIQIITEDSFDAVARSTIRLR